MSWIIKKSNGIFEYRWYESGIRKSKSLETKSLVVANKLKKRLDLIYDEKGKGFMSELLDSEDKEINIQLQIEYYLKDKAAEVKKDTLNRYYQHAQQLLMFFEKRKIVNFNQLNSSVIKQYKIYRTEQGISNKTIHEDLTLLKSVIKSAVEEDILDKDPVKKWPKLKRLPAKPETLGSYSIEEVGKLLDYFKSNEIEFYPVFLFAVYSGCRWGELKLLKFKDVDLQNCLVVVQNQKTGSCIANASSLIRIPYAVLHAVTANRAYHNDTLLFPQLSQHAQKWSRQILIKACKALDIQYRRCHGTRHTYITAGLNAGIPTMYMQNQARHSKLSTTDRYAHSQMITQELVELIHYPHQID